MNRRDFFSSFGLALVPFALPDIGLRDDKKETPKTISATGVFISFDRDAKRWIFIPAEKIAAMELDKFKEMISQTEYAIRALSEEADRLKFEIAKNYAGRCDFSVSVDRAVFEKAPDVVKIIFLRSMLCVANERIFV